MWEGSWFLVRYLSILLDVGRLDNLKWLDIFKKSRYSIFLVIFNRCKNDELVMILNWVSLVIIICGFSFLISFIIRLDWCGDSMIVIWLVDVFMLVFYSWLINCMLSIFRIESMY